MYLRKNSNTRTEVSFDEPLNTDWDGKELLLSDVMGTEEDVVMRPLEEDVDRQLLHSAVAKLSPREQDIISLISWGYPSPIFPGWKSGSSYGCGGRS